LFVQFFRRGHGGLSGGATASGEAGGSGGGTSTPGQASGGASNAGGKNGSGGVTGVGVTTGLGGQTGLGGGTSTPGQASGGASNTGGKNGSGGANAGGGVTSSSAQGGAGASNTAGKSSSGGANTSGGSIGSGGKTGSGGTSGSIGGTSGSIGGSGGSQCGPSTVAEPFSASIAGTWDFTPTGGTKRTLQVPGGGWAKQGVNASSGTYATQITVPDSGAAQTTLIEFGAVPALAKGATRPTTLLIFNDTFSGTSVDVTWEIHSDSATGTKGDSGTFTVDAPFATMATKSVTITAPTSGTKFYLVLRAQKNGTTVFEETDESFTLQ